MINRRVLILSQNPETLDGVQAYLGRFGAVATGVSRLQDAESALPASDALLVFADDYPRDEVSSALLSAAQKLCVVVTEDIESVERSKQSGAKSGTLVLLRRPVWGWMLLDALRVEPRRAHV